MGGLKLHARGVELVVYCCYDSLSMGIRDYMVEVRKCITLLLCQLEIQDYMLTMELALCCCCVTVPTGDPKLYADSGTGSIL